MALQRPSLDGIPGLCPVLTETARLRACYVLLCAFAIDFFCIQVRAFFCSFFDRSQIKFAASYQTFLLC
ncbi:hypothetical protein D0864_01703 [Hortaea werneckii]|uniref:Uncharacterized protein n=1 Tax=Hortaea werneckii TaxID=91943 RepID=A0A3M7H6V2_HORWE|nr:hypothetical protein D0864_01703 [Hortaea werneckii]